MLRRIFNGCLLRPADLRASHETLEVAGVFNPGATQVGEQIVLMARVAETPHEQRPGFVGLPRWEPGASVEIDWVREEDLTLLDPRVVRLNKTGAIRLTFISHLRLYQSADGRSFEPAEIARFTPADEMETYGVEDPRITPLDGAYYITYVAVSKHGAATALARTEDFKTFERMGVIFPSENKDVLLFPERIGGEYVAFHRPNPAQHFSPPEMWLARSPDLIHWGRHEPFRGGSSEWERGRVGGGCPPILLDDGWLEIYHGNVVSEEFPGVGVYTAGAVLLERGNPHRILRQAREPIMMPEAAFEREGFVPNVVFPTGVVRQPSSLLVYYGAADANVGVVEWDIEELSATLT